MWVTVHPDDDEARHIWLDVIGLPAERLVADAENFWDIGPGPCGPNSEIYFDQGASFGCDSPDCEVGCDCDRYLEVWNHVFSQYNHQQDGSYVPLPRKNIDTGMGLERLAAIVQGVGTNFEIDLFRPTMHALERLTGLKYQRSQPHTMAFDVIADHIRAISFAIGDGALPANEGRGYVIRRLLRRAVRFGKVLDLNEPFLYRLVETVVQAMGEAYPELASNQSFIERVVRLEEERFHETLDDGVSLLNGLLEGLQAADNDVLDGQAAFRLYDTFGFPLDLTEEIAAEQGIKVDRAGFEAAMSEQRERARAARSGQEGDFGAENIYRLVEGGNIFVGYTDVSAAAEIVAIAKEEQLVQQAAKGDEVGVLLDQTVFYAEAGGQVADIGYMTAEGLRLQVQNVTNVSGDKILHHCVVEEGVVQLGQRVDLQVAVAHRRAVERAHSATHLVHKALQEVLGEHVHQAGSLVTADQLRFDFSHFDALTEQELAQIEEQVNRQILEGLPVEIVEMSLQAAKELGAMALFGQKYGERVRVVNMGDYSRELCGGTHVANTALIGQFRLLAESSIGSGLRRLEAVTGAAAYRHAQQQQILLREASAVLKVAPTEIPRRLQDILQSLRAAHLEVEKLTDRLAAREADAFLQDIMVVDGVRIIARQVEAKDMDSLRSVADTVKDKMQSGVIVLGAVVGDKVNLVAVVTEDLLPRKLHAGKLIKEVAKQVDGGGGGRPQMAQAGGKDPSRLTSALDTVQELVKQQLGL